MGAFSLAVEIREGTGKGVTRKLRAAGRLPAVLYGHGDAAVSLTLDPIELESVFARSDAGVNTLIDLSGAKEVAGRIVLVKELQRHPVRGTLVHADLFEISADEKINVTVPIHLLGTPEGVKLGGILEHTMREIELECLPKSIPDSVDVDVSHLEIDTAVHLSDVTLPPDTTTSLDGTLTVAHVAIPRAEEEEVAEIVEGEAGEDEGEAEAGDGDKADAGGKDEKSD